MSVLPSPVPHPLDFSPWDLPGWAYEALEWVVGFDWPEGNEKETWDVADLWYATAQALVGPRDEAFDAAAEIVAGYGGAGLTAEAFRNAWNKLADGDDAPLIALLAITHEIGKLCEETGCEIEGAKIEAWIELGLFVIELLALAVTVALTLGAASPAAGGLIAATRMAIQQIFKRLVSQLGKKALKKTLKEAGERTAKQLTSKAGLKRLGKELLDEGWDEAREEFATNLGIQAYQNSTGRRDGLDAKELGMSTWGGFAGGAASGLVGTGKSGHGGPFGNMTRGAGGEILGELGGSLATGGGIPDWQSLGKAGTSGVSGSMVGDGQHAATGALSDLSALSGLPDAPANPSTSSPAGAEPLSAEPLGAEPLGAGPAANLSSSSGPVPSDLSADLGSSGSSSSSSGPSSSGPSSAGPSGSPAPSHASAGGGPSAPASATGGGPAFSAGPDVNLAGTVTAEPVTGGPSAATPATSAGPAPATASPNVSAGTPGGVAANPVVASPVAATPVAATPVMAGPAPVTAGPVSSTTTGGPANATSPGPTASPRPGATAGPSAPAGLGGTMAGPATGPGPGPAPSTAAAGTPAPSSTATSGTPTATPPSSPAPSAPVPRQPADPISGAPPAPAAGPERQSPQQGQQGSWPGAVVLPVPLPRPAPALPPGASPGLAAELDRAQRAGYRDYAAAQRAEHERNRREDQAAHLRRAAGNLRSRAGGFAAQAIRARRDGLTARADYLRGLADTDMRSAYEMEQRANSVLTGTTLPQRVDVTDGRDWDRINDDVGHLAAGGVRAGNQSALTGSDRPPPVESGRRYGQRGGSRPPLAAHQLDLEAAMPRDANGQVARTADPRVGDYFSLANDGGPQADPTRAINCLDCVLSFFDTWVHGRPRVSAPRTFDAYADGDPTRPLDGERDGPARVESATGGQFQGMCPDVSSLPPTQAHQAVYHAMTNLQNHLLNGGHGSFAFVITAWEGGSSHAWAAINQNGTILYVDPQSSRISANLPLYGHWGQPNDGNVVMMDALVTGPDGAPMPLPYHPPGVWSTHRPTPAPTPSPAPSPTGPLPPPGSASPPDPAPPTPAAEREGPPSDGAPDVRSLPQSEGAGLPGDDGALGMPRDLQEENLVGTDERDRGPGGGRESAEGGRPTPAETRPDPGTDDSRAETGGAGRNPQAPATGELPEEGGLPPEYVAEVLRSLPRTELLAYQPLPVLGSQDLPVRRDDAGLIADVFVDDRWMSVAAYLDVLTDQRAERWRQYAMDANYPDIRRAQAQPCISVAIDRRTGNIVEGHNNLTVSESDLHPLLRQRLERYRAECAQRAEPFAWGSVFLHPSQPGTHAEIYAVNELLWNREAAGYSVGDHAMPEILIDNHFPWMRGGTEAPCCGNCTALLRDVPCNAGKLPYFQAPEDEKLPR